ncbi:glycoside hydrolase family 55 protein [Neolentinus lepideus HHB14362 ss-1]|uniref:Glycoside hydrolase family 55 protein n=1 Tax=Neolentinus lepideus HHB14362 ss-1 TaxID=1314782 RepID=A0A165V1X1_9AGAM|nr:glycoside hydrolase family 55 protein [Neolentinus lepideus HHB14362 ss-1]
MTSSLDGSLVLNNIKLTNVPTAVAVNGGPPLLDGGTTTIDSWAQGNVYTGVSSSGKFVQGNIPSISKASNVFDGSGWIFGKTHPQYKDYSVSQIVSVKAQGAKGDGQTDDTAALKDIFATYAACKIIFFDAGVYVVTSTIPIPAGTQIVGEAWTVIIWAVGALFRTRLIHNLLSGLGGAAGTNLQESRCTKQTDTGSNCFTAFMAFHLTSASSTYLVGTWVWLADHDLDASYQGQLTLYSGRGIYSQSQGPVWLIGTGSEHHTSYNHQLVGAANHYMGLIQTESPYHQPSPAPPSPFSILSSWNDPSFSNQNAAWSLRVASSKNILIFGAGLYGFLQNYDQICVDDFNCQQQIVYIDSSSGVAIYSLSTVSSVYQLSINEAGIIPNSANRNDFAQTVTAWTRT